MSASNALVLGVTTAGSPGAAFVNVGIGTATPRSILEAAVSAPGSLGPTPKLVQQKLPTPRVAPIRPGTSQKLPAQSTLQPVEPK